MHELKLMEDPDRRPPTRLRHFERAHQNSDGKWVSESAEQFASLFKERVQANSQPDGSQTVTSSRCGQTLLGPRKDRILGHPRQSARALLAGRPQSTGETSCTGSQANAAAATLVECFNTMFDTRMRMLLGDGYVIMKDPKLHGDTDDPSADDSRGDKDVVGSNVPSRNEEDDDGAGCSADE